MHSDEAGDMREMDKSGRERDIVRKCDLLATKLPASLIEGRALRMIQGFSEELWKRLKKEVAHAREML